MSVTTSSPPQKARTTVQNIGLILAFIVLVGILLLPTPETLSTGGHRMIGEYLAWFVSFNSIN